MASQERNNGERIVALFPAIDSAERAIVELRRLGIRDADISVALPKPLWGHQMASETGVKEIDQPSGVLPGILSTIGRGSNLVRTVEGLGFAEHTAQTYAERVDAGAVLLAIQRGGVGERVRMAIEKFGAFDVRTSSPRAAQYAGCGYVPGPVPEIGDQDNGLGPIER